MLLNNKILPSFNIFLFVIFILLVGLNALLSYSHLTWSIKFVVGILGFGTMGWIYIKNRLLFSSAGNPLYTKEIFVPKKWLIILVLFLALVARLYKLITYLSFPIPDEVINAYNAIHMKDQWSWNYFYFTTQMPPFYIWLLALVFKIGGVNNLSLWLTPALLSFLSAIFYYQAFREIFSWSLSIICLLLLAIGFWPVFLGRFSHNSVLMIFFEAIVLWFLAKFYKADSTRERTGFAIALGICLGLGFYTYFGWPFVALWVFLAVCIISARFGKQGKVLLALVMTFTVLSAIPLIISALKEGFGSYLQNLFIISPNSLKIFQWDFQGSFIYIISFLWTGYTGYFTYNPQWGGLLNPVFGSFFIMGMIELFRHWKYPLAKWMLVGFIVLLAPCFLAHNSNWFHVASLMPLFIVVTAWGFSAFWFVFPRGTAKIFIAMILLLFSIFLDWINLEKTMSIADRDNSALNPTVWTCNNLAKFAQKNGPGRVYSDFCLDFTTPHTTLIPNTSGQFTPLFTSHWLPCYLSLGTYSINTLINPSFRQNQATWAVLTTDEWAQSLLSKWFSGAYFFSNLNHQVHDRSDNSLVAVLPLTSENRLILDDWREADRILRESDYKQFNHPFQQPYDSIILFLKGHESIFRGNSFLRFCYWGKLGYLYYMNQQFDLALSAYQKALQNGANGFLYFELANIYEIKNLYSDEKDALLQAAKWDSFYQPRSEDLKRLDALIVQTHTR